MYHSDATGFIVGGMFAIAAAIAVAVWLFWLVVLGLIVGGLILLAQWIGRRLKPSSAPEHDNRQEAR